MDCPSCGRANASDRVECSHCEALLVDVFEPSHEKTDPMLSIGGATLPPGEEPGTDWGFTRLSPETQYSGDLPRLFRFGNRYQVLEKLGEGGMGRVYKAIDLELDRPVALKTIRAEKRRGPEILKRFKQELVLARKITHKNVVRIYDLGEADGMKFFTMELVEGKSLRDVLRERKPIPIKEAISYLKQMLAGLAEAHRQGVVHRDLKPQNIMVDPEGGIRILDFGIARTADTTTLTGSDAMMGTPDYISPEQIKGDTATGASDLYSTGVILYELLTGEVPFKGDTPIAKVVARLQAKPAPPRSLQPEIPGYLERIVLKLMEVDPDLRYRTAEEVLEDLEREQVRSSLLLRTKKAILRKRGWIAAAGLAGALATGSWYYQTQTNPVASADVAVTTLAILPFHNLTGNGDLAWMERGIPEMLITNVSQSRALRPVLAQRIDGILRELGKTGQSRLDEQTVQAVTQSASADYSLHGSFVQSQGRLRMDLLLKQAGTGVTFPLRIEGAPEEIFDLVDEITGSVSKQLDLDSWFERDRPFTEVSTGSIEALQAYYRARVELQKGANQAAIPLLQEAVRHDPEFAMAHAVLADILFSLGDEESALSAIQTAESLGRENLLPLPERYQIHAISARIHDDPDTAVASYRELAKLFPRDPDILNDLASSLENLGIVAESVETYRGVLALSPQHGAALLGLGRMLVVNGQPQEAIPLLEQAVKSQRLEDDPESLGMIHSILGVAYSDMAQYEAAIRELERSLVYRREIRDVRGVATSLSNLAAALRRVGRIGEAHENLLEALTLAKDSHDRTMESLALLNLGNLESDSGNYDRALIYYRESLDIEWERNVHTEMAFRLDSIAEVLRKKGMAADALVYLRLAESHLEQAEDPIEKAFNQWVQANIKRSRGDYQSAQRGLLDMIAPLRRIGAGTRLAEIHLSLASLYTGQGRFDEALQSAESARDLLGRQEDDTLASIASAEIYLAMANGERASQELARSRVGQGRLKYYDRHRMDLLHARTLAATGDRSAAFGELERLLESARGSGLIEIELEAAVELGRTLLDAGIAKETIVVVQDAYARAAELRLRVIQATACLVLAKAHWSLGDSTNARRYGDELLELAAPFDGKLLMAEGNQLLASIAESRGLSSEADNYVRRAQSVVDQLLPRVPTDSRTAFSSRYFWARSP